MSGGRLAVLALAGAAIAVPAVLFGIEQTAWPALEAAAQRMQPVQVEAVDGTVIAMMPRHDAPKIHSGDGTSQAQTIMPLALPPPDDLMQALDKLEGNGWVLGIHPLRLARGAVCLMAFGSDCSGGSTLTMQAVRAITNDRTISVRRKFTEIVGAVAVQLHFFGNRSGLDTFIADHLFLGYAYGKPIFGVEMAAQLAFGRSVVELTLAEQLMIAAAPKHTLNLSCALPTAAQLASSRKLQSRAQYVLDKAFSDDSRYAATKVQIASMPPLTQPAGACSTGHPMSGLPARLNARLQHEMAQLPSGVRALKVPAVANLAFASSIGTARSELIRGEQRGHWLIDPSGSALTVLAFTSTDGNLMSLAESSYDNVLDRPREIGSIAKLAALAFLAQRAWAKPFCNRARPPYKNAGGDSGVTDCVSHPIDAATVWGRSLNLAVLAALEEYPEAEVRTQLQAWGFQVPTSTDARYALAFGLVSASPVRIAALTAALANGMAGRPATGTVPSLIAQYRTQAGWHQPEKEQLDLSSAFASAAGRALVREAAGASLMAGGTLSALGPGTSGSIAKSGTLDDDQRRVRFKAAAGSEGTVVWFAMAAPARGAMGDNRVSILPLARVARDTAREQASIPLP